MPELPEVETIARQLRPVIVGKMVQSIDVHKSKSWHGDVNKIIGKKITDIQRRAKTIRIVFGADLNLLIHLKMSGQLIYIEADGKRFGGGHPTADWVSELPSSHTRVIFTFTDGTKLFFNDQRIFGWLKIMNDAEIDKEYEKYAPDIIDPEITTEYLLQKAAKRKMPVKIFIMDNTILSGVGNIYACDALNLAKISPLRPVSSLSAAEMKTLLDSMRTVINLGIKLGGATVHGDYVHVTGLSGKYQTVLRVYNRKGDACPNCGELIQKIKLGGRGTYFCKNCQN